MVKAQRSFREEFRRGFLDIKPITPFAPKPSSKRSFKPPTLPLLPLSGSPERQFCSLARDWKNYMLQSHIIYYTISYYIHIHTHAHTHARMHAYTHTHTHTHRWQQCDPQAHPREKSIGWGSCHVTSLSVSLPHTHRHTHINTLRIMSSDTPWVSLHGKSPH